MVVSEQTPSGLSSKQCSAQPSLLDQPSTVYLPGSHDDPLCVDQQRKTLFAGQEVVATSYQDNGSAVDFDMLCLGACERLEGTEFQPTFHAGQLSRHGRVGSVWLGQRSMSPTDSRDDNGGVSEVSTPSVNHNGAPAEFDEKSILEYGRDRGSVLRSRIAGVLCIFAVVLIVLACSLPRWLVRGHEVIFEGPAKARSSNAVSMGLFTVCEDSVSGQCHAYINSDVDGPLRDLLWDVPIDNRRDFYRATCICAILASILGTVAACFNFAVPKFDMFKYHMAIFAITMITVVFASTSMVCWFAWSSQDLRRHPDMETDWLAGKRVGGRFSLGLCFYFMLISSILMTIAGKVVLFEMFVSAKREKKELADLQNEIAVLEAEDFASVILPESNGLVITNALSSAESNESLRGGDVGSAASPPPQYRDMDILTNPTLCQTTSNLTMESSATSMGPVINRDLSDDTSSCASSLWKSTKSEGGTPHHLCGATGSRGSGTLPRNFKSASAESGVTPRRKTGRRFLNRQRWSTTVARRSQSNSEIDVISNHSARHLDEDVTTYSVVPKAPRRNSLHSSHSMRSNRPMMFVSPSPNFNIGNLDFDFSLCMKSMGRLESPPNTLRLNIGLPSQDDGDGSSCHSDESTPVVEQAEFSETFSSPTQSETLKRICRIEPTEYGTPVASTAALEYADYTIETDF